MTFGETAVCIGCPYERNEMPDPDPRFSGKLRKLVKRKPLTGDAESESIDNGSGS